MSVEGHPCDCKPLWECTQRGDDCSLLDAQLRQCLEVRTQALYSSAVGVLPNARRCTLTCVRAPFRSASPSELPLQPAQPSLLGFLCVVPHTTITVLSTAIHHCRTRPSTQTLRPQSF